MAFVRLRRALLEADLRFGELGDAGLFEQLDAQGHLRHRLIDPADVRRALDRPPEVGRASLRGEWVRRLAEGRGRYLCDWMRIWDQKEGRYLDLSDPFAEQAEWRQSGWEGRWEEGPARIPVQSPLVE